MCEMCDEAIVDGHEFVEINGCGYHTECISTCNFKELMELIGISIEVMDDCARHP